MEVEEGQGAPLSLLPLSSLYLCIANCTGEAERQPRHGQAWYTWYVADTLLVSYRGRPLGLLPPWTPRVPCHRYVVIRPALACTGG